MTSEDNALNQDASRPNSGREARKSPSRTLTLPETLSVKQLAEILDESAIDIIKQLMRSGIMVSMNQIIDHQVASVAANALGIRTKVNEDAASSARLSSETGVAVDDINFDN